MREMGARGRLGAASLEIHDGKDLKVVTWAADGAKSVAHRKAFGPQTCVAIR